MSSLCSQPPFTSEPQGAPKPAFGAWVSFKFRYPSAYLLDIAVTDKAPSQWGRAVCKPSSVILRPLFHKRVERSRAFAKRTKTPSRLGTPAVLHENPEATSLVGRAGLARGRVTARGILGPEVERTLL